MRFRKWWIVGLAAILIVLVPGVDRWRSLVAWLQPNQLVEKDHEDAITSSGYAIRRGAETVLDLPENCPEIRFLTNAAIKNTSLYELIEADQDETYSLAYEFHDHRGNSLKRGAYDFRSKVVAFRNEETGEVRTSPFFPPGELIPTATQTWMIPKAAIPKNAKQLRLRLKEAKPSIVEVVVRSYVRIIRTDTGSKPLWDRLPPGRRDRLASSQVFPPDALSSKQIQDLIENDWSTLLPIGIQSVDYESRVLYASEEIPGVPLGPVELPAGLPVGPNLRGLVPLPGTDGRLRLCFERQASDERQATSALNCRLHFRGGEPQQLLSFEVSDHQKTFEISTDACMLEVEASTVGAVRAFWSPFESLAPHEKNGESIDEDNSNVITRAPDAFGADKAVGADQEREITPDPTFQSTYRLEGDIVVEYSITHLNDLETPIRVVARTETESRTSTGADDAEQTIAKSAILRWELLDQHGVTLGNGEINVTPIVSLYDRVADWKLIIPVSDPQSIYFRADTNVKTLRLQVTKNAALVTVFTRPPDLPKTTQVPDDYSAFARHEQQNRTWFFVRAIDHKVLIGNQQTVDVKLQTRPPQANEDIQAGRYTWHEFNPRGQYLAKKLLVPRQSQLPSRDSAYRTTYRELQPNREYDLELFSPIRASHIQPRIIFDAIHTAQPIRVFADGNLLQQTTIHSRRGEFNIGPLQNVGRTRIKIEADSTTRFFINHVREAQEPLFQTRIANRFDDSILEFDYEKLTCERETLLLRFFEHQSNRDKDDHYPIHLEVSISPEMFDSGSSSNDRKSITNALPTNEPTAEWTPLKREFEIRPSTKQDGLVVGDATEKVDCGELIYLPLGSDLPAGSYRIKAQLTDSLRGYLMLYQTRPGSATNNASVEIWRE